MKTKRFAAIAGVLMAVFVCSVGARAQASNPAATPVITVEAAGKTTKIGAAQLAKLKRVSIKTADHGTPAAFEGIAMADVLTLAGVELGEKLRGKRMTEYVLVEAADKYRAVYALAEFDSSFTDNVIVLADKRDGKPLQEKAGNWQIIVPGEKRGARWVRQVISIKVLTAN